MAQITCKECGTQIPDSSTTCPNCGAPVSVNSQTVFSTAGHEKIYYADKNVIIGDKVWEFIGYDNAGTGGKTIWLIPVNSVAGVSIHKKYPRWWIPLVIGLIVMIFCIIFSGAFDINPIAVIMSGVIAGIVLITVSLYKAKMRSLIVSAHNPHMDYTFDNCSDIGQAMKYMVPMRQCLLDKK